MNDRPGRQQRESAQTTAEVLPLDHHVEELLEEWRELGILQSAHPDSGESHRS